MRSLASPIIVALLLFVSSSAEASGLALHIFMADLAVERVTDPALRELLERRRGAYRNGSVFADTGYAIGHPYGEYAHWHDFLNRYARAIERRCGSSSFDASCEDVIGHFLGAVAHSVADVNFDRNFVTEVARREFGGDIGKAQENVDVGIDFLTIFDHNRGFRIAGAWAPTDTLLDVFRGSPVSVSSDDIFRGTALHGLAQVGETLGSPFTYLYYKLKMPWAAANYYGARGGIDDTATLIARAWDLAWAALRGGEQDAIFRSAGGWPNVAFEVDGREIQSLRRPLYFSLVNRRSGLCMDIANFRMQNGTNVLQWHCTGAGNQLWSFDRDGHLRSKQDPSFCLDNSGQVHDGGNVIIWRCNGGMNQKYVFQSDGSLRNVSNRGVVVDGYGPRPDDNVGNWTWHGGDMQRWDFRY